VPLSILMNILKDLVNSGLVTSTRGARGGYSLARPVSGITVNEVISATEGRVNVLPCCGTSQDDACQECRSVVTCPITVSVRHLNDRINEFLNEVTVHDLMSASTSAIAPISTAGFKLERRTLLKGER
jgi:Rrf2 family protein